MIGVLVFLLLLLPMSVLGFDTVHQVNYGVVFEELPPLYSTAEFWSHTFVIDTLPPSALEHHVYRCNCPLYGKVFEKLSGMQRETIDVATQTSSDIIALVEDIAETKLSRRRRTVLPFLSKKAHKVKGRARSRVFVHKIVQHLKDVEVKSRRMQSEFTHGQEEFTSFMSAANTRVHEAFERINKTHGLLLEVEKQINNNLTHFQKMQAWLLTTLFDQFEHHNSIRSAYDKLFEGFVSLLNGGLSPFILDRLHLLTAIEKISRAISRQKHKWHLVHTNPAYYYNHADYVVHGSGSKILLTLRFPVSTIQQPFRLFRLTSHILPVDNFSRHGTSIVKTPKYFSFSGQNISVHTEFDERYMRECDDDVHFTHCHFNVRVSGTSKDCATALFTGHKSEIHDLCNFRLFPNSVVSNIIPLNISHFLLINISEVSVRCLSGLTKTITCQFCVVRLPCNCDLVSRVVSISARISHCHKHDIDIKVTYPVNAILLQKYFGKDSISHIAANESLPEANNMSMKPFDFFRHTYNGLEANDKNVDLNLDVSIAALKAGRHIHLYGHRVDHVTEPCRCSTDTASVPFIMSLVALTLIVITMSMVFIIYLRIYKLLTKYNETRVCTCKSDDRSSSKTIASMHRSRSLPSVSMPVLTYQRIETLQQSEVRNGRDRRRMTIRALNRNVPI